MDADNSALLQFSISVFVAFFAIMNPITNIPIYLSLVDGFPDGKKKQIARVGTLTAFLIVAAFTVFGNYIFELFGITIPAFKITGGLLLFYIGFEMLMSHKSSVHSQSNLEEASDVAISPLAIPILAGPGTIVAAMNNVTSGDAIHVTLVIAIFAVMVLITYFCFLLSDRIVKFFGKNLISVISKLMGLILAIMGVQMVISGITLLLQA